MVVASFLRRVTHPKIFARPVPMSASLRFIDAKLAASGVDQPSMAAEWPTFRKLCVDMVLSANDVPHARPAAAVIAQGELLVSFDADFHRLLPKPPFTQLTV